MHSEQSGKNMEYREREFQMLKEELGKKGKYYFIT